MNIEEVDKKFINKFQIDVKKGLTSEIAHEAAKALKLPAKLIPQCEEV